jgi:signal transduction histidine kinase
MPKETTIDRAELMRAYVEYEKNLAIDKCRVACLLGVVFMPAGVALDYMVYPEKVPLFFGMRVLCSLLLWALWWLFSKPWGQKHHKALGMVEVSLPLFFISLMIATLKDPAISPYYAGLNLVLMGAGIVLRWTLMESAWLLAIAMGMYLAACFTHGPIIKAHRPDFFNNIYFLFVTGVFAMAGNYVYSLTRFREFELRYQIDAQKKDLEEAHDKLKELDHVKSRFFANISHELRTPLTLLLAPLERLRQELAHGDSEMVDLLATMQANGMRLLKLINDLLDLVRLESGQMAVKKDPVAVESCLFGVVA